MSKSVAAAPIVFEAIAEHTATVIIVHGLADNAVMWSRPVEQWRRNGLMDNVKFVLPNAAQRPISAGNGIELQAWFDIKLFDGSADCLANEDDEGIRDSQAYLQSLVQAEIDGGIPAGRVLLGGFSQGGALALLAGLTAPHRLGGVFSLSAWLLRAGEFAALAEDCDNRDTPVLMAHGVDDRMVAPAHGKASLDALKGMGWAPSWEVYP
jgi:lysophospholipase-1